MFDAKQAVSAFKDVSSAIAETDAPLSFTTREQWLKAAEAIMAHWVRVEGYDYPSNTRVACGWPKKGKGRGDPIGQCWSFQSSTDGSIEMFISPSIGDASRACDILLHEMVHATVGNENGHNKLFGKLARALGMEGKLTATIAGADLKELIETNVLAVLGAYPHAELRAMTTTKKAKTYLIKMKCPECEYPAYTTQKWIDSDGTPLCPSCDGMSLEIC